jgi:hypothetical protein
MLDGAAHTSCRFIVGLSSARDMFECVEAYGSRRMVQWGEEKLILMESGKVTRRRVERTG